MPETTENKMKTIGTGIIKEIEKDHFAGYASTGSVDRDGDIVLPSAFEKSLEGFVRTGSILAGHRPQGQDGKSLVVGKPKAGRIDQNGLWIEAAYAPTELAQEYKQLIQGGFISGMSVCFLPKRWEDTRNADGSWGPRVYQEADLLEISVTPIPANRDALIQVRGKEASEQLVDAIIKELATDATDKKETLLEIEIQKAVATIWKLEGRIADLPTKKELETILYEILGDVLDREGETVPAERGMEAEAEDHKNSSDPGQLQAIARALGELNERLKKIA